MTLRLPRFSATAAKKPIDALDYEIAQEMAGALGRLGSALERALRALGEFDAAQPPGATMAPAVRAQRRRLVAEASRALWHFVVQREVCGLRDSRQILRDYGVPPDVRDRMGAFP
jgi:uncharacterized protein DUF6665